MKESTYLAALHLLPGMSQGTLRKGMQFSQGSASRLWENLISFLDFFRVTGNQRTLMLTHAKQTSLDMLDETLQRENIEILTESDSYFPFPQGVLMQGRPYLLYIKGDKRILKQQNLAIVGARKITPYGERVLEYIIPYIVQSGFAVTSGLAKGVDAAAHRQTLRVGGATVAVVGTGLDLVYPHMHRPLEREIMEKNGCLLSEFPLGTKPLKWNFPLRNRLIARIAQAVIVAEAGVASGSIRTAEWALRYNTPVYAVPGSIFSEQSRGANELISQGQEGVRILSRREDILECAMQTSLCISALSKEEQPGHQAEHPSKLAKELQVFADFLHDEPQSASEIARKTGLSISATVSALGHLELYDAAREVSQGWVSYGMHRTS